MENGFRREQSPGYMTNWAARLFARAIDNELRLLGLSSGQIPVFFALGNGGALSQKALVEIAEIEQPTMAATLSRMERDGLIERQADPRDRRSTLVSLTPAALEKAAGVRLAIDRVNATVLERMTPAERTDYLRLLSIAVEGLAAALGRNAG